MCFSKEGPPVPDSRVQHGPTCTGAGKMESGQSSVARKAFKWTPRRGRDKTLEADRSPESKVHGTVPQWSGRSEAPEDFGTLVDVLLQG